MQKLTVKEIVEATGGSVLCGSDEMVCTDITTDSRKVTDGVLFIPLVGDKFDGHEFIHAAFDCGAVAVLTQKDTEAFINKTVIRVEDTFCALGDIARYYKAKYRIPTVAVTGSVGKTTTKDMLYAVLAKKYDTIKTEGNFNNEIGLPLTVFKQEQNHNMAVLEMGQSGFGEIHNLASMARPDVAVITNIGMSHIEKLGSQEGIFKAKMEITDFFDDKNVLIVNSDDEFLKTVNGTQYRVIRYGVNNKNCDVRAYNIRDYGASGTEFCVEIDNEVYTCRVNVAGIHNVYNALSAICVGRLYDVPMNDIIDGIADFELTAMRMSIEKYGMVTVINDCYNASPDSVRASLAVLNSIDGKRHIAVLGDILEMGEYAKDAHYELGSAVSYNNVDILVAVGENAQNIADGAKISGTADIQWFEKTRMAAAHIKDLVQEGDVVLVKASRGMKFEMVIDALASNN